MNKQTILQGHLDAPLNEEGERQAQVAAEHLRDIKFDAIFSSDLLRAARTAEIIKLERDLAVQTSRLLRERFYGPYEGQPSAQYFEAARSLLEQYKELPREQRWKMKVHDQVESNEELVGRFTTFLREIAATHLGRKVLVVSHGGVIRTFLVHIGWATEAELPAGTFANGAYVELRADGVDFFVQDVYGVTKQIL